MNLIYKLMKYLKRYNEGLFRTKKITDWKEQLEWIFNNYKSKKVSYLEAEVDNDDRFRITFTSKSTGFQTFGFFGGNKDGKNRVALQRPGLDYDDWPVLEDNEFKMYRDKVQEVSDYLDETENKSSSSISDDGLNLDIDENEVNNMMAQEQLKKLFKPYFGKEYQFEVEYYLWDSESSNQKKIDDIKLTIYDIYGQARPRGRGGKPDFFLMVKCKVGDRKMKFMVDESNLAEYVSIDEIPRDERYSKLVKIHQDEDGLSRKEKRALKNHGYPYIIDYEGVPSDWAAIEFMKECKNLIDMFNDEILKNI